MSTVMRNAAAILKADTTSKLRAADLDRKVPSGPRKMSRNQHVTTIRSLPKVKRRNAEEAKPHQESVESELHCQEEPPSSRKEQRKDPRRMVHGREERTANGQCRNPSGQQGRNHCGRPVVDESLSFFEVFGHLHVIVNV